MAIGDDWNIDYTNKFVSHSAGAAIYSVNALYSWLQDTFDEQGQMDDPVPMSAQTPSEYTLINGWFIPNISTRYLASGSIQTSGYDAVIRVIPYTVPGPGTDFIGDDIGKQIIGTATGDEATLLDFTTDVEGTKKIYCRQSESADTFDTVEGITVTAGTGDVSSSVASVTGEDVFTNIYTLGSLVEGTELYVLQSGSAIFGADVSWWSAGHIDILLKVQESGIDIDGSDMVVFAREFQDNYDHFSINAPGGRNAVPLATSADGFNTSTSSSVALISGSHTFTFGSTSQDLDNGAGSRPYDVIIDCGGHLLSGSYEVTKLLTDRIEGFKDIDDGAGLVTGSVYREASLGTQGWSEVKTAPFGTYTGTFFAARGVYLTNMHGDDAKNFALIDSSGSSQSPPNTVGVTITSVSGSDRVAVFRLVAAQGEIDKTEYITSGSENIIEAPFIHISGSITTDTPKDSVIRVGTDAYRFTNWTNAGTPESGSFELSASISTSAAYVYGTGSYVPLIDTIVENPATTATNTLVQTTTIPVLIRVRQTGILPFQIEGTVTSNGLSIAAIRTTDAIITI